MLNLNTYIIEKLKINKDSKSNGTFKNTIDKIIKLTGLDFIDDTDEKEKISKTIVKHWLIKNDIYDVDVYIPQSGYEDIKEAFPKEYLDEIIVDEDIWEIYHKEVEKTKNELYSDIFTLELVIYDTEDKLEVKSLADEKDYTFIVVKK